MFGFSYSQTNQVFDAQTSKYKRFVMYFSKNRGFWLYYRSKLVQEYLVHSRIKIEFLPSDIFPLRSKMR